MRTHPATPPTVDPKQTSGGTFDPDAPLSFFIAGGPRGLEESGYWHVLVAVNELSSDDDMARLDRMCDTRRVMLDSGIFSLAMNHARAHETSHDEALSMAPEEIDGFDRLWDRYAEVATRYADRLWGVVELDQGGIEHKPRTRARIENELGIVPMPVYHPLLDGWDYYDTLAANYDRICYGNLVKASPPVRLRLIHAASERARDYPHLWTHLLGVYPNENLLAMPLRGSCDSSSWLTSLRWMPSWKAWAMGKMLAHYPPPMWYGSGDGMREYYERAQALNANTSKAMHHTIGSLVEDTHPWLKPAPRETEDASP